MGFCFSLFRLRCFMLFFFFFVFCFLLFLLFFCFFLGLVVVGREVDSN